MRDNKLPERRKELELERIKEEIRRVEYEIWYLRLRILLILLFLLGAGTVQQLLF
jgi:hypothetical protein